VKASFRTRLTVRWTVAYGLVLASASVAVWLGARALAYRDLDAQVRTLAATELASAIDKWAPHIHDFPDEMVGTPQFADKVVQLVADTGEIVAQTRGLELDASLLSPAVRAAALAGAAPVETVAVGARPVRLAALSMPHGGRSYVMAVGLYTDRLAASLWQLAWLLAGVWVVGLGVTAAVGFVLASRALEPIDHVTQRAARIARGDLEARLDPPAIDDELGRMTTLLNEMLDRLHAVIDAHRHFAADASHELKSPLTALLGEIDVTLKRDRAPAEYRETLGLLRDRIADLTQLADDLIVLLRAEESRDARLVEEVPLTPLVEGAFRRVLPLARQRGITLRLAALPDLIAYGDARLLARAVDNLIANAVHYDRDGGTVAVSGGHAAAAPGAWQAGRVWLDVRDTGPGIPPGDWERIFERFTRLDRSRSRRTGGSGLGLAICRAVVTASGGSVGVRDSSARGTTFELSVPGVAGAGPVRDEPFARDADAAPAPGVGRPIVGGRPD